MTLTREGGRGMVMRKEKVMSKKQEIPAAFFCFLGLPLGLKILHAPLEESCASVSTNREVNCVP